METETGVKINGGDLLLENANSSSTSLNESSISIPSNPDQVWTNRQIILTSVLGLITLVTILANLFVLYIFMKGKRKIRTPTNLLLANLAVADLLVGLVIMPPLASTTILDGKWIYGRFACQAFDYTHFLLCGASMWSMIGVGVDRYIGVSYPFKYKNIFAQNRTILLIISIWLTAACVTSGPLAIWPKILGESATICFVNFNQIFLFFLIIFAYWIPISATLIIYFRVYKNAINPFNQMTQFSDERRKSASRRKSEELRQIRLTKSIALVTGTLFIFYGPIFVLYTIQAFDLPYFSIELLFVAKWIRYSSSTVNPFLYALAVPGYRQEMKERLFAVSRMSKRFQEQMSVSYASRRWGSSQTDAETSSKTEETSQVTTENGCGPHPGQSNKVDRYCSQCGFSMTDLPADKNCEHSHIKTFYIKS